MSQAELTGGQVNYYLVQVKSPSRPEQAPYQAECEDIIRALGMTFDEGTVFKSLWRSCNMRKHRNGKPGADRHGVYDAEKIVHASEGILKERKRERADAQLSSADTMERMRGSFVGERALNFADELAIRPQIKPPTPIGGQPPIENQD